MPASLSWLDYDAEAHQRAQRVITMFSERETRDELGVGSIRDAISDTLFPGTSIIHTRLRYMLFIPWIYTMLEEERVTSAKMAGSAREAEVELIEWLLANSPGEVGIIGKDAGSSLKTLPSAIYWAGLGSWGLRLHPGTKNQYHNDIDQIYLRRRRKALRRRDAQEEGDDIGGLWDVAAYTWNPGIPPPPAEFPDCADFRLSRTEAAFLQDRLKQAHPGSLLAHLAARPKQVQCDWPWEHPDFASFGKEHQQLLDHAHNFSLVHLGAAILYNLLLAERRKDNDQIKALREEAREWSLHLSARLDYLRGWAVNIERFWDTVTGRGHKIGARTMTFCETWLELALTNREAVFDKAHARQLVRNREMEKKKANSRFTNPRMLEQWNGRSGLIRMRYRWNLVSTYIDDLAVALKRR